MTRHFINGIEVTPRDLREIGFKSNIERWNEVELNRDRLIVANEGRDAILSFLSVYGYGHGIPYTVVYDGLTLEYYIDTLDNLLFRDSEIEFTIRKRRGKGSFFERAEGMSFEQLVAEGVQFDFVNCKYVIVKDNQTEQMLTVSLGIFTITNALVQAIRDLANLVADIQSAIGVDPSDVVAAAIKVAAQIIYVIGLIIALTKLVNDLRVLIFPKIREFASCRVRELLVKSCQHLGYSFQSTYLDALDRLTIVPVPFRKDKPSIFNVLQNDYNQALTKGYPTANDTTPTLKSLIDAIELTFKLETRVVNGVVRMETESYWVQTANVAFDAQVNLQEEREEEYSVNTDDLWVRYYINYLTDISDIHSIDKNKHAFYEFGNKNFTSLAPDLNLLKGLKEVNIPFAQGTRKDELNFVENTFLGFLQLVDLIAQLFGAFINTAAVVQDRIGVMQISNQYFNRTKLLFMNADGRQPENYVNIIGAPALWSNRHSEDLPNLNSYRIFRGVPIPCSADDFGNLLNSNFVVLDGVTCELLEWEYVPDESKLIADVKYPSNDLGINIANFVVG